MLAALLNVPRDEAEWSRFSFNNWDAVNQIRAAILRRLGVTLPEYQLEPIAMADIETFMENNQQAHNDFNSVLGLQSSDLLHADLHNENEREAWVYLNYSEVLSACQALRIGP